MIDAVKSSHEVLDVEIAAVTMEEAVALCASMAESGRPHFIATANAEMLMMAKRDAGLKRILRECDLVLPDGAGILWAGEQLGTPFPERVTGADLSDRLLRLAREKEWPVYFLGGAPGVAREAADRYMEKHGKFLLAGVHDGYFDEEEEKKIIREIRDNGTRLLLVGMGVPKQENWLCRHRDELGPVLGMVKLLLRRSLLAVGLFVLVLVGIGGVFDIMAGRLTRAPLWMQRHRLEWAYRLFLQPSRIGRMTALPKYMLAVKRWKKERDAR